MHKYWVYYLLAIKDTFAYRGSMFIYRLGNMIDLVVIAAVWLSADTFGHIGSFSGPQIISYYAYGMILSSLVFWAPNRTIQEEILNGTISSKYLTKPASHYWQFFFSDLAWHTISPILGFVTVLIAAIFFKDLIQVDLTPVRLFWTIVATMLGGFLCFNMFYFLGLLAFYFSEIGSISSIFWMGITLFGGTAIPLDFYPKLTRQIINLLPFRYIFSFPLEIYLSRLTIEAILPSLLVQIAWILFFVLVCKIVWNHGLKTYSSYGN